MVCGVFDTSRGVVVGLMTNGWMDPTIKHICNSIRVLMSNTFIRKTISSSFFSCHFSMGKYNALHDKI